MDAYTAFAAIYDSCMDNIPYDRYAASLRERLSEYGIRDGIVCELGCGTGEITMRLADMGYDMIGIDLSEEMLMEAREKQYEAGDKGILYLNQDMREFELYGTVRAVISACDSMNYLLTEEDLLKVFRLVNNYLDPGGVFLFDLKTEACFSEMGDETRVLQFRDATVIWENSYRKRKKRNTYRLTLYLKEYKDRYQKFSELHEQQAYPVETVKRLLTEAGMVWLNAWDADTGEAVGAETKRILFAAREGFQSGKCYVTPKEKPNE